MHPQCNQACFEFHLRTGRERYWCLQQSHGPANVSHGAGNVRKDTVYVNAIRNNYFYEQRGWGIDLDDGSSNYHVYNNLCVGISIKLREGDFRLVENNIFDHPANPPGFHAGYEHNHDRFVKNITVTDPGFDHPDIDINFKMGLASGAFTKLFSHQRGGRSCINLIVISFSTM